MLKNSIRNINNRLDETSPVVHSHQDWDHNNYNFDSEHFNYDNFEVAPLEDEQSAYLSMCALANYSAGAVSSLGNLDAGSVQNVNLAGVNQHKACLSSIGSTMESTLQNMGNALNVRYTAEMENQGLFGGEPGQLLDIAGYLREVAAENTSDILDQIAGFGQQTGVQGGYQPQYDESVFTDPAKLSSTYQEIAGRDPSTWSEEDKYVIMAYYNDLAGRTAAEKAKADENAGWATDDLSYYSIYGKYDELKAEQNKMEKMLKANGMMEYSDWEKGWQDIKAAGKALVSEGSDVIGAIKDGDWKGAWHEFTEFNEQLLATGAVVTESTVSGVLKIGEYVDDGAHILVTTVATPTTYLIDKVAGTDITGQMWDATMDDVARDKVGEGRQWFYEGTPIGQYINEQSQLKWDSAGSQLIQDVSEKAGEVAIITAATVASGGTAAPLLAGVGFLKGTGEEAERRYNLTDENGNYTNRSWKDTGLAYLSGLAEAAEWYGTSQAIGAATQGINAVKQMGFDGIKQMVSSGIAGSTPREIAKTVLRGAKNSLLEADTWIDVGTGLVDFVVDGVNTGEWNWGSLAVDTVLNLGGNMLGGSAGEILGGSHGMHPDLDIDGPNPSRLAIDAHSPDLDTLAATYPAKPVVDIDEMFDGGRMGGVDGFVPDGSPYLARTSASRIDEIGERMLHNEGRLDNVMGELDRYLTNNPDSQLADMMDDLASARRGLSRTQGEIDLDDVFRRRDEFAIDYFDKSLINSQDAVDHVLGGLSEYAALHPDNDAVKYAIDELSSTLDEMRTTRAVFGDTYMDVFSSHDGAVGGFIPDGAQASLRYTNATTECMDDMEYAIRQYMDKYNCSRAKAIDQLDALVDEHSFKYMTSAGGARGKLMQYDFDELSDSLKALKNADNLPAGAVDDVDYAIKQFMYKYNCTRAKAIEQMDNLISSGDYYFMTSAGGARSRLMQYDLDQLDAALNKLKYSTPNVPQTPNIPRNQFADPRLNNSGNTPFNYGRPTKQDPANFFGQNASKYGASYGVDQGAIYDLCDYYDSYGRRVSYREAKAMVNNAIENNRPVPRFRKTGNTEYFNIKNGLQSRYGLSAQEASVLMSTIDDAGACSYAAVCNEVFDTFNGSPQLFEQKFGFPMYKTVDGVTKPNYEGLLVDMYVNVNMPENGGRLLVRNWDGTYSLNPSALSAKVDPLGRQMLNADNQLYLSGSGGKNNTVIDNYLKSKGLGGYSSSVQVPRDTYLTRSQLDQVGDYVKQGIADGKEFSLGIYKGKSEINIISLDGRPNQSTFRWNEGGGHAVYVTGVTDRGFVVSSWGGKYLIPYDDLAKQGAPWLLNESEIKLS